MKTVYIVENYLDGGTCVYYTAEKARENAIKSLINYWNEYEKKYHEDDAALNRAIEEIRTQAEKYEGEFDTDNARCYEVPIVE